jgi:hypothetical protein
MTISGKLSDGDWSVAATTHSTMGGFECSIQLSHHTPEGIFKHEFKHGGIFSTEPEAALAGLREGMDWIRLEMSNTLSTQPGNCRVEPE